MADFTFPPSSRRREARFQTAFPVLWGEAHRALGYTTNLSHKGFCVRTRRTENPGTDGEFVIRAGEIEVSVLATVSWIRQVQAESSLNAWHEMGLEFMQTPPAEYLKLLSLQPTRDDERRVHQRFIQTLRLTCWNADLSLELVSFDVSEGGVRVISEQRPPHGTRFNVDVHLPGEDVPVALVGEVLRNIEDDGDVQPGGFVIEVSDVSREEQEVFFTYLRRLNELTTGPYA